MFQRPPQHKDFGVFLPVANGGWIVSKTTPTLDFGLYAQNRAAAVAADEVGMDFVMSMGKFRGFGGETDHWGTSLESVTLMAAIAEATKNVRIWATVHPLLQNPAVAAKMIATLDHISGGRAGLNIVAGAYKAEFDQMSAWDDSLSHDDRYALAEEWTTDRQAPVDRGQRRLRRPVLHDEGLPVQAQAAVQAASGADLRGHVRPGLPVLGARGRRLLHRRPHARGAPRRLAPGQAGGRPSDLGNTVRTYAMCTIIHAESDAKAQALVESLRRGRGHGRDPGHAGQLGRAGREAAASVAEKQGAFMTETVVGSPASCREQVEAFVTDCELDGLMLIFPDYVEGLAMFGAEILPKLRAVFS
jgi:pyrimidine oxygenase